MSNIAFISIMIGFFIAAFGSAIPKKPEVGFSRIGFTIFIIGFFMGIGGLAVWSL